MSRTLIAATDFSAPARHALERAALLARDYADCRLVLAHVINERGIDKLKRLLPGEAAAAERQLLAQAQSGLDDAAQSLGTIYPGPIEKELMQGVPLERLAELAESRQADLTVMGARGAHFVREMLLGSTTERVLRMSRRPLLAVKQRPLLPYRRILAPVDFSEHSAAAVNAAHAWLPNADIVLLNAFEVELESTFRLAGMSDDQIHEYRAQARAAAMTEMEDFIAQLSVPPNRLSRAFVHGAATLRIIEHEQSLDADLIVMGKRGQSMVEELLLGSVTKHVLVHSSSDVFIAGHAA